MSGKGSVQELVLLDQAGQALAEAKTLDEIKVIRDKAEAVRKYAQNASLGLDVQNRAAEVKLRAERQAGRLLAQMTLRGGDRRSKSHSDRLKLNDLGLTANQSKRWQLQARVPEHLFRDHIQHTREAGKELTSAGVMRLAKRLRTETSVRRARGDDATINKPHGHGHPNTGSSASSAARSTNSQRRLVSDSTDEFVDELVNHHKVLDGILRPLYLEEVTSLRASELRILRYLMRETSAILAGLEKHLAEPAGCDCHKNNAAG